MLPRHPNSPRHDREREREKQDERTTLRSRLGDRDLDRPALPADLLVAPRQPGLAAALLKELHHELPSPATGPGAPRRALRVELALQLRGPLLDHGLEFIVVDVGEGEVEDFAGAGDEGGEEAVEEYGVEDAYFMSVILNCIVFPR